MNSGGKGSAMFEYKGNHSATDRKGNSVAKDPDSLKGHVPRHRSNRTQQTEDARSDQSPPCESVASGAREDRRRRDQRESKENIPGEEFHRVKGGWPGQRNKVRLPPCRKRNKVHGGSQTGHNAPKRQCDDSKHLTLRAGNAKYGSHQDYDKRGGEQSNCLHRRQSWVNNWFRRSGLCNTERENNCVDHSN